MIGFSSIFDINSHLNLLTHLRDKIPLMPTIIHDTSEIANHLKEIAGAIAGLNQNWWDSPLISGVAYTSLGILLSLVPQWFASKRDQRSKVLAALASYESTKISILNFKKTCVDNELKNKFKRIIEEKEPGNKSIVLKIEKLFEGNQLSEFQHEIRLYSTISYHIEPWSKDLHFMTNVSPGFLITLDQATEKLNTLNAHINNWNSQIENNGCDVTTLHIRDEDDKAYKSQYVLIKKHLQFIFDNSESSLTYALNQALSFNQIAIEHLQEYAKETYSSDFRKGYFNTQYPFENEAELMPQETEALTKHKKQIAKMKIPFQKQPKDPTKPNSN